MRIGIVIDWSFYSQLDSRPAQAAAKPDASSRQPKADDKRY
jgi:hypothetical protein